MMNAVLNYANVEEFVQLGTDFDVTVAFKGVFAGSANLDLSVLDNAGNSVQDRSVVQTSKVQSYKLNGITTEGVHRVFVKNKSALNNHVNSNDFSVGVASVQIVDPLSNGFIPITQMFAEPIAESAVSGAAFPRPSKVRVLAFLSERPKGSYKMVARLHAIWNGGFAKGDSSPVGNAGDMLEAGLFEYIRSQYTTTIVSTRSVVDAQIDIPITPSDYPNWRFIVSLEPEARKTPGASWVAFAEIV